MRQVALQDDYTHFLVSENIIDNRSFYSNKGILSIAPLYLYPDPEKKDMFNQEKFGDRIPNLYPEFYKTVSEVYAKELSPEEIFYYIYAVLYSNTYRTKYAEFLKIDFPRVPFTKDYKVFTKMAELGEKLVNLHLLKSPELDSPVAKFPIKGEDKVDKPVFLVATEAKAGAGKDGRVYINKDQYFEGVDKEVWEYQIGGYQVCNKWLKDRKGRKLLTEDIVHYCKVITALKKTIDIQKSIDGIYDDVEKDLIEF